MTFNNVFFYSGGHQPGSFANINSGARFPHTVQHDIDSLDLIGKLAKPEAKITIVQAVGNGNGLISASKLVNQMKLAGLITVQEPKALQSLSSDQLKKIREILSIPEADIFEIGKDLNTNSNYIGVKKIFLVWLVHTFRLTKGQ